MDRNEDQLKNLLEDALQDLLDEEQEEKPRVLDIKQSLKNISEATGGSEHDRSSGSSRGGSNDQRSCPKENISFDEEEMNKFFENMTQQLGAELPKIDPDEARARINESVPQIFDLMQNLLSKELLYPALKDLPPKFDEWLNKNSSTLSKAEVRRYKKQRDIINEIILVLDDETLAKQERFEKNLELMERMSTLGPPPAELGTLDGVAKCSVM